jgi:hypothetical protein
MNNTDTMRTKMLWITPSIATAMLEKNTKNRRIDMNVVRHLADLMKAGKWRENGETIKFSSDGQMIDGQHRLSAIVLSGCTVPIEIREGLDADVIPTIDIGKKRTVSDVLKIMGRSNTNSLAAAVNWANFFLKSDGVKTPSTIHRFSILDAGEQAEFIEANPHIIECVNIGNNLYQKFKQIRPGILTGQFFVAHQIDPVQCNEFFNGIATGAHMDEYDARMVLRRRLILRSSTTTRREPMLNIAVLHTYAWNAFREGRTLRRLLYTTGDAAPKMI